MVYLYNCKDTKIKDIVLNNQIYYRDDRIKPYVANTNIFLFHEDLSSFLSNELMWDELLIKDFLNNFTQTNKLMKDLESQNYHSNTFDNIINDRNRRFMSKNFIKPRLFYSYLKSYLKIKYNKKIEDL